MSARPGRGTFWHGLDFEAPQYRPLTRQVNGEMPGTASLRELRLNLTKLHCQHQMESLNSNLLVSSVQAPYPDHADLSFCDVLPVGFSGVGVLGNPDTVVTFEPREHFRVLLAYQIFFAMVGDGVPNHS